MTASLRELCALVAIAAVASGSVVKAETCSTSETDDTTSILTQYATDISSDCYVDPCSDNCFSSLTSIANSLPDCEYIDGVNYYEALLLSLQPCADISGGTTTSGSEDTTGTTTDASSSVASDSTECSTSDLASTESYINQYSDTVTANCDTDPCSSDCITTVSALTELLPNCIYSDGTNYYETVGSITSACMGTSAESAVGSEGSSTTASGSTCSASELSDTDSYLAAISADYSAACGTDYSCTSDCLAVMDTLSSQLPDCVYTDGTNYYESVLLIISTCGSTTTSSDSSSTGATASSGSDSTPSALRTLSPGVIKDSSSKSSNGAADVSSISAAVVAFALGVAQILM
jgi:hypothetical protein